VVTLLVTTRASNPRKYRNANAGEFGKLAIHREWVFFNIFWGEGFKPCYSSVLNIAP